VPRFDTPQEEISYWTRKTIIWSFVGLVLFILLSFFTAAGCKEYDRYQKRENAQNNVKVTRINIDKARQESQIRNAQIP
jgi:hypothetical protein